MNNLALPGADLVNKGLDDLRNRSVTLESLLVSQAVKALSELGYLLTSPILDPEWKLYQFLEQEFGDGAHSKYNAYRRQLASFLRAARCVQQ